MSSQFMVLVEVSLPSIRHLSATCCLGSPQLGRPVTESVPYKTLWLNLVGHVCQIFKLICLLVWMWQWVAEGNLKYLVISRPHWVALCAYHTLFCRLSAVHKSSSFGIMVSAVILFEQIFCHTEEGDTFKCMHLVISSPSRAWPLFPASVVSLPCPGLVRTVPSALSWYWPISREACSVCLCFPLVRIITMSFPTD